MTMEDWVNLINKYLLLDDRDILKDAGKISHEITCDRALTEFEKYRVKQDKLYKSDFDNFLNEARIIKNGSDFMNNENINKTNINWYPGHMAKTKREINDIMPSIDVVLEIIDARIPFSSHIPDLDKYTKSKTVMLIFNKYDLCDKEETEKWIKYYESKSFVVVPCNSKDNNDYKKILVKVSELMKEKNIKRHEKGLLPKKAKCLVVGVPNVGKSTLINRIVGKKIVDTANKPGVTKRLNTIRVNNDIDLVDTPGILWPKIESEDTALNLASMSIIKEEIVPITEVGIHILLKLNNYKEILKKEFDLEEYDNDCLDECFIKIAKSKSIAIRKDDIDYEKISLYILNMIKQEKITNITFDRFEN